MSNLAVGMMTDQSVSTDTPTMWYPVLYDIREWRDGILRWNFIGATHHTARETEADGLALCAAVARDLGVPFFPNLDRATYVLKEQLIEMRGNGFDARENGHPTSCECGECGRLVM